MGLDKRKKKDEEEKQNLQENLMVARTPRGCAMHFKDQVCYQTKVRLRNMNVKKNQNCNFNYEVDTT